MSDLTPEETLRAEYYDESAIEKRTLFAYAADLVEQAREGDTT